MRCLALLCLAGCTVSPDVDLRYDLLIRGARVVDGTGRPAFAADVAVRGDRIEAVGPLLDAAARRVIDARGLVLAPAASIRRSSRSKSWSA